MFQQTIVTVLCLALSALPTPSIAQTTAEVIWTNARIYTANTKQPWAEAMAVRGGALMAIGDQADAAAHTGPDTVVHDLGGRLVLPGLIDAHAHPGYIAMGAGMLELPEAPDRERQLEDIAELLAAHPDKPMIEAIGWENAFFGVNGPHRRDLDALEPERPVIIHDVTMHTIWVNSAALERAGVDRDVVDPLPGVAYYKRDLDGELTGYITESAATEFARRLYRFDETAEQVLLDYLEYLASVGVTTLFDAGNFGADEAVYAAVSRLEAAGQLPVRYFGSYTLFLRKHLPHAIDRLKALGQRHNSERVRIDTLKIFLDGVVESRTAFLLADYSDMPGNRGGTLLSSEELEQLLRELDRERLNVHIHALGDQAVRTSLDAVEAAREALGRPLAIRVALTHLQLVDRDDWPRFAELDVIAQFTPAWHGFDVPTYQPALGERAAYMYPVRPLLDSGAVVNFSSDVYFPSEWRAGLASPFVGMQIGSRRQYTEDAPDGPRGGPPHEQLPLEALVDGYTRSGAWQLGQENVIGTLEPGRRADFIVLNEDLFTMNPTQVHAVQAALVVLDGQIIIDRSK